MKKVVVGIVLCFLALAVPGVGLFFFISAVTQAEIRSFEGPGTIEVQVDDPGRYFLWNEYRTVFEGRSYSRSEELPDGVGFSAVRMDTGESISFRTNFSITHRSGQREKASIGYFEVTEPGLYRVSVEGLRQTRIFAFGQSSMDDFGGMMARGFFFTLFSIAAMLAGLLFLIFGILELVRKRSAQPPPLR
jgi:hypothetical protein